MTYVIIGTAAAGLSAATTIARLDPQADLICISDEKELPYNKCVLVDYMAGSGIMPEQLITLPRGFFDGKQRLLLLGTRVVGIDAERRVIFLHEGAQIGYNRLLCTMGSRPVQLVLPGLQGTAGIFNFYNLNDVERLTAYIQLHQARRAVIIGGGLSGLECADALHARGLQVTVIERSSRILLHHTDVQGSQFLQQQAQDQGIHVITNAQTEEFLSTAGRVCGIRLHTGEIIATDVVVCTVGLRPNSELLAQACARQGGCVVVDAYQKTIDEAIYAAGDVVVVRSQLTGELVPSTMWADAALQGLCAAHNMVGREKKYPGLIGFTISHFFDSDVLACGRLLGNREIVRTVRSGTYRVFELEEGVLKAFSCFGATHEALAVCRRALLTQERIDLDLLKKI